MDRQIFVVTGSTGEWSNRSEWLVRAFLSEEAAELYVTKLENTYRQFPQGTQGYCREDKERDSLYEEMTKLDPRFDEDYTGTYWHIRMVGLCEYTLKG